MTTETNETAINRARRVLEAAHKAWLAMADFRRRRRRYIRYTYGDQWGDPAPEASGAISEGEAMRAQGARPLTNNLIRRMVKAVVGRYRMQAEGAGRDDADTPLGACRRFNCTDELDARTFEEFLISGVALQRVGHDTRRGRRAVWVDIVNPETFFITPVGDPRGCDTELVGRFTDMSIAEVCMRYGCGDPRRTAMLRSIYASAGAIDTAEAAVRSGAGSFYQAPEGRCRVIEVWTLECRELMRVHDPASATMAIAEAGALQRIERINRRRRRCHLPELKARIETTTAWHCRIMAPDATILAECSRPATAGHPFAIKFYPLVDGDVHSLVEDVIDQQRHVNRMITIMDRMMATAAKGVLLFPSKCKPDELDWADIVQLWADPGGVIPYRPVDKGEPHQVVTPLSDPGISRMLQTQIEMFQDVSGVSDALMGRNISAGVGAERYRNEVANASLTVDDLIKTFAHFIATRDNLIARTIK